MKIESVEYFKYTRVASLDKLLELAHCRHYSTFCLYNKKEFANSIKRFEENIRRRFKDVRNVFWIDENVLLVVNKRAV